MVFICFRVYLKLSTLASILRMRILIKLSASIAHFLPNMEKCGWLILA